jgi:2'-5' RNA ligase
MSKPNQKQMAQQVPMKILNEHLERAKQRKVEWHLNHPGDVSPAQRHQHKRYLKELKFKRFCIEGQKQDVKKWEDYRRVLRVKRAPKRQFKNLERKIRREQKTVKFFEDEARRWEQTVKDLVLNK